MDSKEDIYPIASLENVLSKDTQSLKLSENNHSQVSCANNSEQPEFESNEGPEIINFFVKTLSGKKKEFSRPINTTIENLKILLGEGEGIYHYSFRLIFKGQNLDNEKHLSEYDIKNGSVLLMAMFIKG
jgi:hypothetical protein